MFGVMLGDVFAFLVMFLWVLWQFFFANTNKLLYLCTRKTTIKNFISWKILITKWKNWITKTFLLAEMVKAVRQTYGITPRMQADIAEMFNRLELSYEPVFDLYQECYYFPENRPADK